MWIVKRFVFQVTLKKYHFEATEKNEDLKII
jgi:hypothetical protein